MCGIAGIISTAGSGPEKTVAAESMAAAMTHRGPDDSGAWTDDHGLAALSHRRLSIIDLSPEGRQPMVSSCERFVISYNGEVYNFPELRKELESGGARFRGRSDTEVILEALAKWGVEKAAPRFVGMFAIALWDRKRKILSLIRDRLGIKPLYYGEIEGGYAFASELKALRKAPGFNPELDAESAAQYFRYGYFPSPRTVYKNARSLRPGHIAEIKLKEGTFTESETRCYWSGLDVATNGGKDPFPGGETEAVDHLDELLTRAVGLRMVSDVPLGAFLSGGIDSSLIVALMQKQSAEKIKTFTIGFHEKEYDEAGYAKKIAAHLGTEHTELYISEKEAQEVIPKLPSMYDEPFSDQSQIPCYLVSQLARGSVTVALTGDGGDELFGGYEIYKRVIEQWNARSSMGAAKTAVTDGALTAAAALSPIGERFIGSLQERLLFRRDALRHSDFDSFYRHYLARYPDMNGLLINNPESAAQGYPAPDFENRFEQMMYTDMMQYLPDDILVKMDRASMSVSLEARVPMIDHNVVEFAWRLPFELKVRDGKGKYVLRKLLTRYAPEALVERPKMGFAVPVGRWIAGPLREWAESLLMSPAAEAQGVFNHSVVREKWNEHVKGKYDHEFMLWSVLMYLSWMDENKE